jgi:hypothetical protein
MHLKKKLTRCDNVKKILTDCDNVKSMFIFYLFLIMGHKIRQGMHLKTI